MKTAGKNEAAIIDSSCIDSAESCNITDYEKDEMFFEENFSEC